MRALSVLFLLFLAACNAAGGSFSETLLRQDSNANIVVYRPNQFIGAAGYYEVDVNGITKCKLLNAGFFIASYPPGDLTVSSSIWNRPGTSVAKIKAKPGKSYFVRMEMDVAKEVSGAVAGFGGYLVAEGMSTSGGPFIFTLVDEQTAKQELLHLKQDCL